MIMILLLLMCNIIIINDINNDNIIEMKILLLMCIINY